MQSYIEGGLKIKVIYNRKLPFWTKSSSLIVKGGLKIEGCKIEELLYLAKILHIRAINVSHIYILKSNYLFLGYRSWLKTRLRGTKVWYWSATWGSGRLLFWSSWLSTAVSATVRAGWSAAQQQTGQVRECGNLTRHVIRKRWCRCTHVWSVSAFNCSITWEIDQLENVRQASP